MSAEIHLKAGGEPADLPAPFPLVEKGRLREIVFPRDALHEPVLRPLLHHTDPRRVPGKELFCKGIRQIIFHARSILSAPGPPGVFPIIAHFCFPEQWSEKPDRPALPAKTEKA